MVQAVIATLNVFDQPYVLNGAASTGVVGDDADLLHQLPEPRLRRGVRPVAADHPRHAGRHPSASSSSCTGRWSSDEQTARRRVRAAPVRGRRSSCCGRWCRSTGRSTPACRPTRRPARSRRTTCRRHRRCATTSRCSAGSGDIPDPIRRSTVNIFIECAAATIITVVLATLAAYAFARMQFRGRNVAVLRGAGDDGVPGVHDPDPAVPDHERLRPGQHLHRHRAGLRVRVPAAGDLDPVQLHVEPADRASKRPARSTARAGCRCSGTWCCRSPVPGIISTAIITFLFAWAQFLFPLVLSSDLSTQPLTVVIAGAAGPAHRAVHAAQRGRRDRDRGAGGHRADAQPLHRERPAEPGA